MGKAPSKGVYRFYVSRHHREVRDHLLDRMRDCGEEPNRSDDLAGACVGLVMAAVGYLECRINEYYSGMTSFGADYQSLSTEQRRRFSQIVRSLDWKRQLSILEKYQTALAALEIERFDAGELPYQDAALLVQFRNELIHHEPRSTEIELESGERETTPKLEARLRAKVGDCPFEILKPFFPQNCLHLQCGEWAARASQDFVDAFLHKVGASSKPRTGSALFS